MTPLELAQEYAAIDDDAITAGQREARMLARALIDTTAALQGAERERDRWRHGVPIEGDYVCPDSLELTRVMPVYEAACAWRDAPMPRGQVSSLSYLRKLIAAIDHARSQGEKP